MPHQPKQTSPLLYRDLPPSPVFRPQANVTKLVHSKLGAITLGIGDGANDVGMIKVSGGGEGLHIYRGYVCTLDWKCGPTHSTGSVDRHTRLEVWTGPD